MNRPMRSPRANAAMSLAQDAVLSLTARPGRTLGMVSAIILAATSATAAITIADTQQIQIDRRFDLQRSSAVVITAQSAADGFDPDAIAQIAALDPVTDAGELSVWADSVTVAVNSWTPSSTAPLIAADPGGLQAAAQSITGADPQHITVDQPLAWIGTTLASRLGANDLTIAQTIEVNGRRHLVAGIATARPGFDYLNTSIVVGRATATALIPMARTTRLVAAIRPGAASAVADYALAALDPTRTRTLADVTPPDGEILLGDIAGDLRLIGLAIGGFVGLAGIVAVANTMSMSVTQRTRELGLRSAIGWTPSRVRALILAEASAAGIAAATIGCALGIAIALIWAASQGWQPILERGLPATAIAAGTLASLIGGVVPAQRAARISPLTAMRS